MLNCSPMASEIRGRPRLQETADDIVASVLATAGARVSSSDYSTRRIATITGLSQSLVSRAIRHIRYDTAPSPTALPVLQLERMEVGYPRIAIEFSPIDAGESANTAGQQRPSRFLQRQSAAIMAALWVSEAAAWQPAPQLEPSTPSGEYTVIWEPGTLPWEQFLARTAELLQACGGHADPLPAELLDLLAARSGQGLHGVNYQRGRLLHDSQTDNNFDSQRITVAEFPSPGRSATNRWLPTVRLSATEQVAVALRKEMMTSQVGPGDRISPAVFAERLNLSTASVRTAMRQLADDGLLVHSSAGFRIPRVTGADVIDLYAARLHMGMVLLPAACAQPRHQLLAARLALGALEATAKEGTRADSGEADLRFQQELMEASGLTQSTRSFHALTLRVRMFISVLQLDYTPAVDRLLHDDRRLLIAVLENHPEDAVQIWRVKLDNAVRHMSALAPESFDAALWDTLTRHR